MSDTSVIEIDGKRMKKCPGWEGNSFRCGRGNPRLIAEEAEVCENCSRGMRKRGQKTREEEEEAERRKLQAEKRLDRGFAILEMKFPNGVGITGPKLVALIQTIEAITDHELNGRDRSWGRPERIRSVDRWAILRKLGGLEAEDRGGRRYE